VTRGGSIETGVGVNLKPETWNFELPFSPRWGEKGIKEEGLFSLIRFPRVPRRAAVRPRRSTRGYIPTPQWGWKLRNWSLGIRITGKPWETKRGNNTGSVHHSVVPSALFWMG